MHTNFCWYDNLYHFECTKLILLIEMYNEELLVTSSHKPDCRLLTTPLTEIIHISNNCSNYKNDVNAAHDG